MGFGFDGAGCVDLEGDVFGDFVSGWGGGFDHGVGSGGYLDGFGGFTAGPFGDGFAGGVFSFYDFEFGAF